MRGDARARGGLLAIVLLAPLVAAGDEPAGEKPASDKQPDQQTETAKPEPEPTPQAALAPRYCYETLARVDCHAAPLANAQARRVGWFDAPVTN